MEQFLREGQGISAKAMSVGDAHFFEDSTPPGTIRDYLDFHKVMVNHCQGSEPSFENKIRNMKNSKG
jgi:hypothetical protein